MSQFNTYNQSTDPLGSLLTPTGSKPAKPRQPAGPKFGTIKPLGGQAPQGMPTTGMPLPSSRPAPAAIQQAAAQPNAHLRMGGFPNVPMTPFAPVPAFSISGGATGAGPMTVQQPAIFPGTPPMGGQTLGFPAGYAAWDQALANAIGFDMRNQQGAMNELYGQVAGQIGQYEQALGQGLGTLERVGQEQRGALQGIAGGLEQKGQQGYEEFKAFRDQQMQAVGGDISKANQQAAAAVQNYRDAIKDFKDTSAQDAANAAFGLRRDAEARMQEIDMVDASPAEKAALKQQLTQDVSNQVTQSVTGIFSGMNQQMAAMQGNLSSLMSSQAQQTLAGGQLRGQVGTAFGAQTLDAQRLNQQMTELGANLRVMGEQAYASAMQQSVMLSLQGRRDLAEMIQSNPRQFVSVFAGLSGFLAAATTPGINEISLPNFGAIA